MFVTVIVSTFSSSGTLFGPKIDEGKSLSVPLVSSVGEPSREIARGFCSAKKSLTCSR